MLFTIILHKTMRAYVKTQEYSEKKFYTYILMKMSNRFHKINSSLLNYDARINHRTGLIIAISEIVCVCVCVCFILNGSLENETTVLLLLNLMIYIYAAAAAAAMLNVQWIFQSTYNDFVIITY